MRRAAVSASSLSRISNWPTCCFEISSGSTACRNQPFGPSCRGPSVARPSGSADGPFPRPPRGQEYAKPPSRWTRVDRRGGGGALRRPGGRRVRCGSPTADPREPAGSRIRTQSRRTGTVQWRAVVSHRERRSTRSCPRRVGSTPSARHSPAPRSRSAEHRHRRWTRRGGSAGGRDARGRLVRGPSRPTARAR